MALVLKDAALEAPLLLKTDDYIARLESPTFFNAGGPVIPRHLITHRWRDINLYRTSITHSWGVAGGSIPVRINHFWRVRNIRNRDITHRWRVLTPGTIEAYSDDIQLPFSEREIEIT